MAISEVCKFEVKEELDRLCNDKGISRNEASKELAIFYKEVVGVEVDWQTVKKKDQRARQVGTNVPSKQHDAPIDAEFSVVSTRAADGAAQPKTKDPLDSMVDVPDGAIKHDNDSKNLFHLKQYWRKTNKKDRSLFRRWIGLSEFSASDQEGMRVPCPHCNKTYVIPWANVRKALLQRESKNT